MTHYRSPHNPENRLTTRRALIGVCIIGAMILVLLARIAYLQILEHNKYATLSDRNQLRLVPIPPTRGLIYDRTGKLLARNVPAFHLALVPEQIPDLEKMLEELKDVVPFDEDQKQAFLDKVENSPPHQRQLLRLKLTEEEVSSFAVNQFRFPGASLVVELIRDYPYGALMSHVVGYVSEASLSDLAKIDKKRYAGTYHLGKMGLEKHYEDLLQGQPGYQQMETNVLGREVRTVATISGKTGQDLHLSVDVDLQKVAMQALGEHRGALVAIDPQSGEILALASNPGFDPNQFVRGLDKAAYNALKLDPARPLFNRALQGQYPPASTIKPIVGLSGLINQKVNTHQKIFDPGWYQLNGVGRLYRDWEEKGHGWTDFEKALRESCDIYYYQLAEKLGIGQMSTWFSHVGLGKVTGIDLPGEQAGLVPTPAWKKRALGKPWYPGETIITGIGQGYILATPLQLAVVASYIANRGEAYKPHLNKGVDPEKLPPLVLEDLQSWETIIAPMHQVTQHPRGTAYRYFTGFPIPVAGKTGTAQVFGIKANEKYERENVADHLRDHSLFICFAPVQQPKIAIAVILENGRASASAARQVLDAYFGITQNDKPIEPPALPS